MYNLQGLWPYVWSQHSKKASACDGFCDYLTRKTGKEFESSSYTLYKREALATLAYFSVGSGKVDRDIIGKTHPRSILAFSKAAGLGCGSFLERKG
jgi:hypothetical protein